MRPRKEIPHGTTSCYSVRKCRCDLCKVANASYNKERRRLVSTGEKLTVHGNMNSYKTGCRCDPCKTANKLWVEEYKARRIAEGDIKHGTASGYQIFKCRCVECRAWESFGSRKKWLKTQYGIDIDQFLSMLSKQADACAACGDKFNDPKSTHIDHNHATNKVRALLCRNCNLALGFLKDDPKRISRLLDYILKYNM